MQWSSSLPAEGHHHPGDTNKAFDLSGRAAAFVVLPMRSAVPDHSLLRAAMRARDPRVRVSRGLTFLSAENIAKYSTKQWY
jgi:hypothetical protein